MDNNSNNREGRPHRRKGCRYFRLHNKGLRLLEEKKFPEAIHCFQKLVRCFPADQIARYNLACSFSLLSGTKDASIEKNMAQDNAIEVLRQAVAIGYSDASHMEKDSDLEPIRARPEYIQILAQLKRGESPVEQPQQQERVDNFRFNPDYTQISQTPQPEQVSSEVAVQEPEQVPVQIVVEPVELPVQEPEQPPVPVIEPQVDVKENMEINPEQEALRAEYSEELKQLFDMGFLDTQKNLQQLKKCNGDIFQVIAQLLD